MGRDAILSKQRVLGTVDECIKLVNDAYTIVEEVREKHGALLTDLDAKFTEVHSRLDAQGRIAIDAEEGLKPFRASLDELRETVTKQDQSAARAFRVMREVWGDVSRDVREHHAFIAQVKAENAVFESLTTWGRLRWLFTGRYPRPLRQGEGILPLTADTPTTDTYADVDRIPTPLEGGLS